MKHRALLVFSCALFASVIFLIPHIAAGQEGQVKGSVTDAQTGESLPGVNIYISGGGGTATDSKGNYELRLEEGKHTIAFSFIGYKEKKLEMESKSGDTLRLDVDLVPTSIELNTAVVSASRYEQRLADVTVSMEVIPADFIENVNTYSLDNTLNLFPGVDVLDGQANIRGGSGYTYGAGSRVMVMIDELPILTGDVNDVKWDALPLELIEQVEVIKGASSALYGSSALNGVINLRTASPGLKPLTTVELSGGLFMRPKRDELTWWWDRTPFFSNLRFSHFRKAGPVDISIGGSGLYDEGYRKDNYLRYMRLNAGIKYKPEKLRGFTAGVSANFQTQALADFLIWQDADSGAFLQNPDAYTPLHGTRFNIDPFITYYDKGDGRHSLKTRYYLVKNKFDEDPDKDNGSDYFYGEYQYHKKFMIDLHWSIGAAVSYTEGKSNLYGDHFGSTMALYTQLDKKFFDRLSLSFGLRWERYTLDRTDDESKPVIRAGVNFQVSPRTFIRASYGEGYRYPSMAEKYTSTGLASLNIFPNPDLTSETGWSAEIGVKKGLESGRWSGYFDVALFWTEYENMIEFIFGLHNPDSVPPSVDYIGFKSINTGKARINGVDISFTGQGMIGQVGIQFFAGYTYINPLDLSTDTIGLDTASNQVLKYRYKHSAKADVALQLKSFDAGITVVYRSFMERIDPAFEEEILGQYFFPGLKEYRQENNKGAVVFDFRIGWQVSPSSKVSLFAKNLFNREYMGRPGDIQPPRSISVQYLLKI